ncbi:glutamate receptor 2 [Euphorbia peplus]|nr:glutamate receptor 2 [Euphorbia peplus]
MAGFVALFFCILVLSANFTFSNGVRIEIHQGNKFVSNVGGVIDCFTRAGREEKIAMNIAVQDFYNSTGKNLSLHTLDLSRNSSTPASAAINLIQDQKLQAIVGSLTWQEAVLVSETNRVPILSLTPATSLIMPKNELPVINMFDDLPVRISLISAFVASFKWQKVIALYEETNPYMSNLGIITLLSTSLRDHGVVLEDYSAFPAMSSVLQPNSFIRKALDKLKGKESKVFIVLQSSLTLSTLLFEQAKQMGMMEKSFVWIMADESASLIDSFDASMMASMQGVVGFKTHYSETSPSFKEFEVNFVRKFRAEYPEEMNFHPSLYALRAYDSIWTIGKMLENRNNSKTLLQHILSSDFEGLCGRIHFKNNKLADVPAFRIFNIVGKSYRELGFWSQEYGFNTKPVENINRKGKNMTIEETLGAIYWPGGTTSLPTGLAETETNKQVRIAVPESSMFTQFVKVIRDVNQNVIYIGGFSIRVFEAAVRNLQYPLIYNLVPFYGSHDDMIKEVSLNNFDAAIGDILISANRNQPVEFSQPYVESNLVMVVPKTKPKQEFWMFLKPFSKGMWLLMAVMVVCTGFVVWSLEHRINSDFRGPPNRQIGTSLWFAFSTVVFAHRESIRSQWTKFVLAPWFFLILIITSTYTANLSSMLTNPQLEPSETDIGLLKTTNATVGCDGSSFIFWYLKEVLGLKEDNIKNISSPDDFANSLSNGHIKAAFLLSPHARVFVSEHCQRFTISGPTFKLSGFGYVFPKGSALALDISEAIIYLKQSGELQQLEEEKLSYSKCSTSASNAGTESLGVGPFAGLFIVSGSVSAIGLTVAVIRQLRTHWEEITFLKTMWLCRGLWLWIATFLTPSKAKDEIELSIERCDPPIRMNNTCHPEELVIRNYIDPVQNINMDTF